MAQLLHGSTARAPRIPRLGRLRTSLACALIVAAAAAVLPAGTAAEQASSETLSQAAGALDAGRHHSCAIFAGTGVRCWGFGREGELGYGNRDPIGDNETPGTVGAVDLGSGGPATAISAGDFHNCALLQAGSVRCWGLAGNGRLGYGDEINIGDDETPASAGPVELGSAAKAITAGGGHTCAILVDNNVRCWGYAFYGQLGYAKLDPTGVRQENIGDNEDPVDVGTVFLGEGRTARAISAGDLHTCALLDDRSVRCWGAADNGQLGYGNTDEIGDTELPGQAGPVALGGQATAISAGAAQTCAILVGGSVRCWGFGGNGRLGYGDNDTIGDDETPDSVPPVDLGRPAVAISVGDGHACAVLDDASVRCWGFAITGQLGYGNTRDVGDDEDPADVGPVDLGTGRRAAAIALGSRHTCARLEDGVGVSCWGYGGNGRLGYCNERTIGDNETPGSVGPVPMDIAVRAPSTAYPGCARAAGGDGGGAPAPPAAPAQYQTPVSPLAEEAARRRALRDCLGRATRHARREVRRARRLTGRRRARARAHARAHRRQLRRRCLKRFGRTPGRPTGLKASALSRTTVVLSFNAPGTDGARPPAARAYLVKQARRPIRNARGFRRAQTLCGGNCRFSSVTRVGAELRLTVEDLRPRTTYYYAVAARDNVSGRLGSRSSAVRVRTR